MFYYVYVLRSKITNNSYIGYTNNPARRLVQHNKRQVKSSKRYTPYGLIFVEGYKVKSDALRREKYLKSARGRTTLKYMLKDYFFEYGHSFHN